MVTRYRSYEFVLKLVNEKRLMIELMRAMMRATAAGTQAEVEMADLVRMTHMSKSTLQGVLQRLTARGWIEREKRPVYTTMHFMSKDEAEEYNLPLFTVTNKGEKRIKNVRLDHPYYLPREVAVQYRKNEAKLNRKVREGTASSEEPLFGKETYKQAYYDNFETSRGKQKKKAMRFKNQITALDKAIRDVTREKIIYRVVAFPFLLNQSRCKIPKEKIRFWTRAGKQLLNGPV